jgi:hypothetical protein
VVARVAIVKLARHLGRWRLTARGLDLARASSGSEA